MTRILPIALAALLAACAAPDSAPQDASAKAQTSSRREQSHALFKQGLNHYRDNNYPAALPLFKQAAALGNARAEGYLGRIYLSNYAQKNHEQAFIHFKAAAEQGDMASEFWLAACYDNGAGTAPDPARAVDSPFPVGGRVRHEEFGDGVVTDLEEDRVTVLFEQVGYRTLSVPVVIEHDLLERRDRAGG